jgi:hypothetical protein
MLPLAIGGILFGYMIGWTLRQIFFLKSSGASGGVAFFLAVLSWPVVVVGATIFLELQYGVTGPLATTRTGPAALFFAGGLYYGVRKARS